MPLPLHKARKRHRAVRCYSATRPWHRGFSGVSAAIPFAGERVQNSNDNQGKGEPGVAYISVLYAITKCYKFT